ncbi:MAG TPA: hypothetical protein PKO23_09370 [Candidatus Hydrogenedentes bacterium]|nr:MAG: hypothetical protein BWY09_01205 [Candidatus Hydrogenedentes bacterium ADurb.Bin179]HOC69008.1 hypothetical protein [Candidatus Hydrogenedentota bacterium]
MRGFARKDAGDLKDLKDARTTSYEAIDLPGGLRVLLALCHGFTEKKHQGKQTAYKENKEGIDKGGARNYLREVLVVFIHEIEFPERFRQRLKYSV